MEETHFGIRIPYSLKEVDFGGKGIFSSERILKGTLVWKFKVGGNVVEYNKEAAISHLATLTMIEAKVFLDLTYGIGGEADHLLFKIRVFQFEVLFNIIF
jgi:hypothetical protein